jgi:phosphoribosylamine--glycine ligase
MRILLVGGGGREHALAWKIAQSPLVSTLFAAPGSDAIADLATCFPQVPASDIAALVELAREQEVDLVVVGPEDPLVGGLADRLREVGSRCSAVCGGCTARGQQVVREGVHGEPPHPDRGVRRVR